MLQIIQPDSCVSAGLIDEVLAQRPVEVSLTQLYSGETPLPPGELSGVILLGGYMGVHDREDYPFLDPLCDFMEDCLKEQIPILGICLGGQLLAKVLGAEVRSGSRKELGVKEVTVREEGHSDPLFEGLGCAFTSFQWHKDSFSVPDSALHLAESAQCPGQAFRYGNAWGVQFHPEVTEGIIESWCGKSGIDPVEILLEYKKREDLYRQSSLRLLGNFLKQIPVSL